jgi:hypothetical protein
MAMTGGHESYGVFHCLSVCDIPERILSRNNSSPICLNSGIMRGINFTGSSGQLTVFININHHGVEYVSVNGIKTKNMAHTSRTSKNARSSERSGLYDESGSVDYNTDNGGTGDGNNTSDDQGREELIPGTSKRGFAAMDPQEQREIASMGGRAAHESGHAHEWTSEEAREAGRRGARVRWRDNKL